MQNDDTLVEIAARVLAPFLEGGRKFDQMPPDRIALRKWCREGMCSTNDATQDDAREAGEAALAVIIPAIEARVVAEIVAWRTYAQTGLDQCSNPDCATCDDLRSLIRGDYKESQP